MDEVEVTVEASTDGEQIKIEIDLAKVGVDILQILLANMYILYTKLWMFHWNYTGVQFNDRHDFFAELRTGLDADIDDTAEHIRQLKEIPIGSLREFLDHAGKGITEMPSQLMHDEDALITLLNDYTILVKAINNGMGIMKGCDKVIENYLIELLTKYGKVIWKINANLGKDV